MLNPNLHSPAIDALRSGLETRIIGQRPALEAILNTYEMYLAGLTDPDQPIGNFLFLGPTGTGKTHTVEALAQILAGNSKAVLKINGGEYQHSHEIAKLIGSPPGYLGHKETRPALSQERIDQYHTDTHKVSLILFDEIEKASDALWKIMLGILDKAELTMGNGDKTNFSTSLIFMTSNLGAGRIQDLITPSLGFHAPAAQPDMITRAGLEAARRKFPPEFFNRLDRGNIVTFQPLSEEAMYAILGLELDKLRDRVLNKAGVHVFFTPDARALLLEKGFDKRYGARPLVQTVKSMVARPVAALLGSGQVKKHGVLTIDAGDLGLNFTGSAAAIISKVA